MRLGEGDSIVTAWAESPSGPGWSNRLVWALVRNRTHGLRLESIQPDDQTADMLLLFDVALSATGALTSAVRAWAADKRGAR